MKYKSEIHEIKFKAYVDYKHITSTYGKQYSERIDLLATHAAATANYLYAFLHLDNLVRVIVIDYESVLHCTKVVSLPINLCRKIFKYDRDSLVHMNSTVETEITKYMLSNI